MARTQVFLDLAGVGAVGLWKTDLAGPGPVRVGEEFTAREMEDVGRPRLKQGGRRLRVRVVRVQRVNLSYHVLVVEILTDVTPPIARRLFE